MKHTNRIGTNQHHIKHRYHFWPSVWFILFVITAGGFWIKYQEPPIISPLAENAYAYSDPTATPSPIPPPTVENIVAYITKTFAPEGKGVILEALRVAFCESGWRPDAYNHNTNDTGDYSIFQVNSVHTKKYGQGFYHDWRANVDTAYKIYKDHGNWSAWVCARKLGIE